METNFTKELSSLTKHPEGSVRELLFFSFPLMLSLLSENVMLFFDRLILAQYSLDAMNAAAAASFFCCILQYGTVAIATISEVFTSQFNSAKIFTKTAQPAWQMVWFSVFSSVIFYSAATWGGDYLLSPYYREEYGLPYFQWFLYFGPFFPMLASFSAFFIGIGKAKIVTSVVVIGNITNILLDILLIFGVPNYLSPMGTKGAAIATGIAQVLQIIILLFFFFNSHYRKKYHTTDFSIRIKLFFKCFRIGFPTATAYMLEMASWAIIARLMASAGEEFLTVMTVGQSLYTLIAFTLDGLQRGVSVISANFIAHKKWDKVIKTWKSGSKSILLFAIFFSIFMVFYPDPLIKLFLTSEVTAENYDQVYYFLRITAIAIWFYIIFDGHSSISLGILTASGDTLFILIAYSTYICFFTFLPVYILIIHFNFSPIFIWLTVSAASFINASFNFIRFSQKKWKTRKLIINDD